MNHSAILKVTAAAIAVVQLGLGLGYLLAPAPFHGLLGLSVAPGWTAWPFAMLGARFLALGFGMILVVRDPFANRGWIQAMIIVQAIDWVMTVGSLLAGTVTLGQVATAPFLPIVFIAGLLIGYPRQATTSAASGAAGSDSQRPALIAER